MENLPLKRGKLGLNSRFDRMVATMNTIHPYRRAAGAPWRRARSCVASSSSDCHVQNFAPKQLGKLSKDSLARRVADTWSVDPKGSHRYFYAQTSYQVVEAVVHSASCTSPLPDWMVPTPCVLEQNDPLRALLPSLEVAQTPAGNVPFEKVPYSSQEEQMFAFCHPDTVDNSSNPGTLPPTLLRDRKHHTIRNNRLTGSLQSVKTSDFYLPTRSPYGVPDCFVSNRRVPLSSHAASSSPTFCKSEGSTAIRRREGVVQDVTLDAQSTPGPTYHRFKWDSDAATEDVLSCNTTEDSSLVFDIDAIDFRWKPFLRSKVSDGHPAYQRENSTSQQTSPYSPVSERLLSDGLSPHTPVHICTNPAAGPLARGQTERPVCPPSTSDDPTNPPREGSPYLSDREESRMSISQSAFPDERPAVLAEPCKFMTAHPSGCFTRRRQTVIDTGSRRSHPRGEGEHLKPPRLTGYGPSLRPHFLVSHENTDSPGNLEQKS